MSKLAHLPHRTVLAIGGADRVAFLQGLVSNDMTLVAPDRAVWAALLSPQGKYVADFFVLAGDDVLLLDCESARAPVVAEKLARFRLRSKVTIETTTHAVHAEWIAATGDAPTGDAPTGFDVVAAAPDPRIKQAGRRVIARVALAGNADAHAYDRHRLSLGLPDGSRDMEPDKSVLLEGNFHELSGLSWTKGCYMGQELTARTRYRGLLKRRLVPVLGTALPDLGAPLTLADGTEIGTMRSSCDGAGLALLRIEHLAKPIFAADGSSVAVMQPSWMTPPVEASA